MSVKNCKFAQYRPISNLNVISKILEGVVLNRLNSHLSLHKLLLPYQSAYRKFHSTETALLTVHNNILRAMDQGKVTTLVLLDLSAAFDTVDHTIRLHRLEHWFGISGITLQLFKSYRTQSVWCNGAHSESNRMNYGSWSSPFRPLHHTTWITSFRFSHQLPPLC